MFSISFQGSQICVNDLFNSAYSISCCIASNDRIMVNMEQAWQKTVMTYHNFPNTVEGDSHGLLLSAMEGNRHDLIWSSVDRNSHSLIWSTIPAFDGRDLVILQNSPFSIIGIPTEFWIKHFVNIDQKGCCWNYMLGKLGW